MNSSTIAWDVEKWFVLSKGKDLAYIAEKWSLDRMETLLVMTNPFFLVWVNNNWPKFLKKDQKPSYTKIH